MMAQDYMQHVRNANRNIRNMDRICAAWQKMDDEEQSQYGYSLLEFTNDAMDGFVEIEGFEY